MGWRSTALNLTPLESHLKADVRQFREGCCDLVCQFIHINFKDRFTDYCCRSVNIGCRNTFHALHLNLSDTESRRG